MTCHMHPGTNMVTTYLGYMWWDNETDGELMYPKEQKNATAERAGAIEHGNPEGAARQGPVVATATSWPTSRS